jgi:NADH dehydrogenase [ubiquinone] 1 alpha subcomplex assembly factor 7
MVSATPQSTHSSGFSPALTHPNQIDGSLRLCRILSPSPSPASTLLGLSSPRFGKLPVGSRLEVSPPAFKIARKVGEIIAGDANCEGGASGGCGLVIDYGDDKAFGDTLRVRLLLFTLTRL